MSRYRVGILEKKDGKYDHENRTFFAITKEEMPYSMERGVSANGDLVYGYESYINSLVFKGKFKQLSTKEIDERKSLIKPRFGKPGDILCFMDTRYYDKPIMKFFKKLLSIK